MTDTDRFPICLPFTLPMECPFPNDWTNPANLSDDAHDPGGRTMDGIIQTEYNAFRIANHEPVRDVLYCTQVEGYTIYRDNYWDWKSKCAGLVPGLDMSVFDSLVNNGPTGATKVLQASLRSIDKIDVDGIWGPLTDAAVAKATTNVQMAIKSFTTAREAYYRSLPIFRYFGRGWISRAIAIGQDSLSMTGRNLSGIRMQRPYMKTIRTYEWQPTQKSA